MDISINSLKEIKLGVTQDFVDFEERKSFVLDLSIPPIGYDGAF